MRFSNNLPFIPFDPKLLPYPHTFEKQHRHFNNTLLQSKTIELIHPAGDNGFPCCPLQLGLAEKMLTNPEERLEMNKSRLDPEDLELLVTPDTKENELKTATSAVPWLRNSEVVSTVRSTSNRKEPLYYLFTRIGTSGRNEKRIRTLLELDTKGKVAHIAQTFEAAKNARLQTLKHPKNSNLTALEVFPVFPDFDQWANPNIMVTFDADPLTKNERDKYHDAEIMVEEAILKPVTSRQDVDDQWAAYYLPEKDTVQKFKRFREESEFDEVPSENVPHSNQVI